MAAFISILIVLLGLTCQWAAGQSCYANDLNPYLYFSTRTSYNYVNNLNRDPISVSGLFLHACALFYYVYKCYELFDRPTSKTIYLIL